MTHVFEIFENNDETFEVQINNSCAFKCLFHHNKRFNKFTKRWKFPNSYREIFINDAKSLNIEVEQDIKKPNIIKLTNENTKEFGVEYRYNYKIDRIVKVC